MRKVALALGLTILAACGGSVEDATSASATGTQGASASAGAGVGAGGATAGATVGSGPSSSSGPATTGAGGASVVCTSPAGDCMTLRMDLRMKLAAAKTCDPSSMNACQGIISGVCCPEVVANAASPETQCYLETLVDVKNAGCLEPCTDEPCAVPQNACVTTQSGNFCM